MTNSDGNEVWDMSFDKYCVVLANNVQPVLEKRVLRLPTNCVTSLIFGYHPDMDLTGYLK